MITPLLIRLKIPRTEIKKSRKENPQKLTQLSSRSHPRQYKSTCIATFCLTFYGSWNFTFLGRNGIARLSGMTEIYFLSMILFSYYYNTIVYDKE